MQDLDHIVINFDGSKLFWLNLVLSVVMYAVALEIRMTDFKAVFRRPKMIALGVVSQFLWLPLLTLGLVWLLPIMPSMALGMLLVAVCPGGTASNFYSMIAKGNIALSVTLTGIATAVAGFMIPLGFSFWSSFSSKASQLLQTVDLDYAAMMKTALLLLLLPLCLGMATRYFRPHWADVLSAPLRYVSIIIYASLIVLAFSANFSLFLKVFNAVFWLTLLHNSLALLMGYGWAKMNSMPEEVCRSICIETGIQNTGIGLVLAFNFFPDLGGLQIIVAWWGIWHLVSGAAVAYAFSRGLSSQGIPA